MILKIDPGSKVTGLAILLGSDLIWVAQLTHRAQAIKASLDSRRSLRRGRRSRHTRYRQARFLNRTRPKGWLAPRPSTPCRNNLNLGQQTIKTCTNQNNLSRISQIRSTADRKSRNFRSRVSAGCVSWLRSP
jgi:hypothetical protein